MKTNERHYYPTPTIADFMNSRSQRRGIRGPRGSGKSSGCCNEIMRRAIEQEPWKTDGIRRTRFAIIRNTYTELRDTALKTWLYWFPEEYFGVFNNQDMAHRIKYNDVETEVLFRALDRPGDAKKVLSLELTGAWTNETKEIPFGIIEALDDTIGRYPPINECGPTWQGLIMDTNSMDDSHWWFNLSENDIQDKKYWEFFSQPGGLIEVDGEFRPNPEAENMDVLEQIMPDYYRAKAMGKSKSHIRVYYCNQYGFLVEGKPVHEGYSDPVHCFNGPLEYIKNQTVHIGLDFGLTPAATIGQKTASGRWQVSKEIVTEHMGIKRFGENLLRPEIAKIKELGLDYEIHGDPAGSDEAQTDEKTPFQILEALGFDAKPAYRNNDPVIRREALNGPLTRMIDGKPGIMISSECKVLRKALSGGFCYRKLQVSGEERFELKPSKNRFSHVAEASEYMCLGAGEIVIEENQKKKADVLKNLNNVRSKLYGNDSGGGWMG